MRARSLMLFAPGSIYGFSPAFRCMLPCGRYPVGSFFEDQRLVSIEGAKVLQRSRVGHDEQTIHDAVWKAVHGDATGIHDMMVASFTVADDHLAADWSNLDCIGGDGLICTNETKFTLCGNFIECAHDRFLLCSDFWFDE